MNKRVSVLSAPDFQKLSEAVHSYCGMRLSREMGVQAELYLCRRMAAMQIADIHEYCCRLSEHPHNRKWERELFCLIEKMTDNVDVD